MIENADATVQVFKRRAKDATSAPMDEGEMKSSDKPVSSEKVTLDAQPVPAEQVKPGKKNLLEGVKIG